MVTLKHPEAAMRLNMRGRNVTCSECRHWRTEFSPWCALHDEGPRARGAVGMDSVRPYCEDFDVDDVQAP